MMKARCQIHAKYWGKICVFTENGTQGVHYLQPLNTRIYRWSSLHVSALQLRAPLTVTPTVTIQETLEILNKEGFDQVPVVNDAGDIMGMVTVGNMMAQVVRSKVKPSDPVSKAMYKQFKMVSMATSLGEISRMLDTDHFVLVVHGQRQYEGNNFVSKKQMIFGIATRIDLLNFITKHRSLDDQ